MPSGRRPPTFADKGEGVRNRAEKGEEQKEKAAPEGRPVFPYGFNSDIGKVLERV